MKKRQLLENGLRVDPVGLGCMSFGGVYGPTNEREAHETLARAVDLGIDFLDTANVYGLGRSEEIVGRFLKGTGSSLRVATKAGIWRDQEHGNRGFNNKPKYLRAELEGSLSRLGLDRVDLFYIHRRDPDLEIEEVMECLLELKAEGKIGGIGFSEIAPASLRRAVSVGPVDAVQSEYSLWSRLPELGLIQACEELGVALVAFSPLGRGLFSDAVPDPAQFSEADFRRHIPRFQEPNFTFNLKTVAQFREFALDHKQSTAAMAIAWCLAKSDRIIPIPGTRSAEHLIECVKGASITMTDEMLAEIQRLLPVGWAYGDRYSKAQWSGPEGYC